MVKVKAGGSLGVVSGPGPFNCFAFCRGRQSGCLPKFPLIHGKATIERPRRMCSGFEHPARRQMDWRTAFYYTRLYVWASRLPPGVPLAATEQVGDATHVVVGYGLFEFVLPLAQFCTSCQGRKITEEWLIWAHQLMGWDDKVEARSGGRFSFHHAPSLSQSWLDRGARGCGRAKRRWLRVCSCAPAKAIGAMGLVGLVRP